jgi:hypothetical protein
MNVKHARFNFGAISRKIASCSPVSLGLTSHDGNTDALGSSLAAFFALERLASASKERNGKSDAACPNEEK